MQIGEPIVTAAIERVNSVLGGATPAERAQAFLTGYDADQSNTINITEFTQFILELNVQQVREANPNQPLFSTDGTLSTDNINSTTELVVQELFEGLDANNDSALNVTELEGFLT